MLCEEYIVGKLVFDFFLCVVELLGVIFDVVVVFEDVLFGVVVGCVGNFVVVVGIN